MPLKKGENDMTSNKVIKMLIVFILCMTVLGCSASTAFADTIYDCSYLINVGEKSYSDTLFYQLITSVPEAADDFVHTPLKMRSQTGEIEHGFR